MPVTGIPVDATATYVSDLDPAKPLDGQAGATLFTLGTLGTLGTLDAFAAAHVADTALDIMGEVVTLHPNRADMESVQLGLRGWRGMQDARGADAPFTMQTRIIIGSKRDVVRDDCLALLTMPLIRELAGEVRRMSDAKAVVASSPVAEPSLVLPAA